MKILVLRHHGLFMLSNYITKYYTTYEKVQLFPSERIIKDTRYQ